MKRVSLLLCAAVVAVAAAFPVEVQAGPSERSANLLKLVMAFTAHRARSRAAGCAALPCARARPSAPAPRRAARASLDPG